MSRTEGCPVIGQQPSEARETSKSARGAPRKGMRMNEWNDKGNGQMRPEQSTRRFTQARNEAQQKRQSRGEGERAGQERARTRKHEGLARAWRLSRAVQVS